MKLIESLKMRWVVLVWNHTPNCAEMSRLASLSFEQTPITSGQLFQIRGRKRLEMQGLHGVPQSIAHGRRNAIRGVPTQIEVKLAIGKALGNQMSEGQCKGRSAHACDPACRRDDHRTGFVGIG